MPPTRRKNTAEAKPAAVEATAPAEQTSATVEATTPAAAEPAGAGPLEPPAADTTAEPVAATPAAGEPGDASPLDPPATQAPKGSQAVLDSPVAPLAPPTAPAAPAAPTPAPPKAAGEHLGYVDDDGQPVRIADVFDLSGDKLMVTAKLRVHLRFRRPGISTVLQSLLYPAGAQVHRSIATALIVQEQAEEERASAAAE